MKNQWRLILGLILVLMVVIFAVLNVSAVPVNFGFIEAEWPLILVILGSLILGALTAVLISTGTNFQIKKELKSMKEALGQADEKAATTFKKEKESYEQKIQDLTKELAALKAVDKEPRTNDAVTPIKK
ncbi:LapA family protein [Isobaculum melis]|uniref:Uncharacterized integral membrane protein n=1 Tax=Isobaculum melis TaxID=142588 RepID=A0A1H9RU11_9LACT|nr:lipopolysaccharide assembly protein LapA domain-containing protein [Isobaculum melis]SER75905.1 Uncharacterized integral membrane protein [Isobaculum melis]